MRKPRGERTMRQRSALRKHNIKKLRGLQRNIGKRNGGGTISKASGGWKRKKPTAKGHCANGAGFRAMIKKPSGLRKHNTETERRRNNKQGEQPGSKHPIEQREDNAQTNILQENNKERKQSSGCEYRNQAAAG